MSLKRFEESVYYNKHREKRYGILCVCSCGNVTFIDKRNLNNNNPTKSCGCLRKLNSLQNKVKDFSGRRFGKLTIIKLFSDVGSGKPKEWICRCDCGNERIATIGSLTSRQNPSCGCSQNPNGNRSWHWKGCGEISGQYFNGIKDNAKSRNIYFSLTIEYCWKLFLNQNRKCALSGIELKFKEFSSDKETTASLDRINSLDGYVEGNVQWIHKDLNFMKRNMNENIFFNWVDKIYEYQHTK